MGTATPKVGLSGRLQSAPHTHGHWASLDQVVLFPDRFSYSRTNRGFPARVAAPLSTLSAKAPPETNCAHTGCVRNEELAVTIGHPPVRGREPLLLQAQSEAVTPTATHEEADSLEVSAPHQAR